MNRKGRAVHVCIAPVVEGELRNPDRLSQHSPANFSWHLILFAGARRIKSFSGAGPSGKEGGIDR